MTTDRRQSATRASAAWAAWGDALGFITELTDPAGLQHRAGVSAVSETIAWRRRVGGRAGVEAPLPAGTYSDDTQLRLATSRSIRGDGEFDVESFARVELVAWQAYHLGAGRGSKAAAAAMTRSDARWNQNTFATKEARYIDVGGNGAAMRIQPHVWAARNLDDPGPVLASVLKDAVCTHGHPVGLLGAAIHALSLMFTLRDDQVPGPNAWSQIIDLVGMLPEVIAADDDLGGLWLPGWEQAASQPFLPALERYTEEATDQFQMVRSLAQEHHAGPEEAYRSMVDSVGGFAPTTRGSGTATAILALALAASADDPAESLRIAANTLGSDTDTIATMAGALMGAAAATPPPSPIQDARLIDREAGRLHGIATGVPMPSFRYPDLLDWNPPRTALDLVGTGEAGQLALAGHGPVTEEGTQVQGGRSNAPTSYQWVTLRTGQSVFLRYRTHPKPLNPALLPPEPAWTPAPSTKLAGQATLFPRSDVHADVSTDVGPEPTSVTDIDSALQAVRLSGHSPHVVGRVLLDLIAADPAHAVERAAAFAAAMTTDLLRS